MKGLRYLIIEAKNPFNDKVGSIYLDSRFETSEKAKQVFDVVTPPRKHRHLVKKGDRALIHFNIVVFMIQDGERIPSHYNFIDDLYNVPENMIHAYIKKNGDIIMVDEWILIKPIKTKTEEVLDSGIILLTMDKNKVKHSTMRGVVYKTSKEWSVVPEGEEVILANHSDYSVFIDDEEFWLVKDQQILSTLKFLETVGEYEE